MSAAVRFDDIDESYYAPRGRSIVAQDPTIQPIRRVPRGMYVAVGGDWLGRQLARFARTEEFNYLSEIVCPRDEDTLNDALARFRYTGRRAHDDVVRAGSQFLGWPDHSSRRGRIFAGKGTNGNHAFFKLGGYVRSTQFFSAGGAGGGGGGFTGATLTARGGGGAGGAAGWSRILLMAEAIPEAVMIRPGFGGAGGAGSGSPGGAGTSTVITTAQTDISPGTMTTVAGGGAGGAGSASAAGSAGGAGTTPAPSRFLDYMGIPYYAAGVAGGAGGTITGGNGGNSSFYPFCGGGGGGGASTANVVGSGGQCSNALGSNTLIANGGPGVTGGPGTPGDPGASFDGRGNFAVTGCGGGGGGGAGSANAGGLGGRGGSRNGGGGGGGGGPTGGGGGKGGDGFTVALDFW